MIFVISGIGLLVFGFYMFWNDADPGYYGMEQQQQWLRSMDILMYIVFGGISSSIGIILAWKAFTIKPATVIPKYES